MKLGDLYQGGVKWFLRLVYLVFALALAAAAYGVYMAYQILTPVGAQEYKTFTLKPGTSAQEVSEKLQDRGFIRSSLAFRLLLKATRTGDKLQAGDHSLSPSMNALQVRDELMKVVLQPAVPVTIPEGLTMNEVAALVARPLKGVKAKELLLYARNPYEVFPAKKYLPRTGMEGYLFPDTYEFDAKANALQVVERFLERFEEVVLTLPDVKAGKLPQKLTLHQLVILASLVEAEAKVDRDRPLIAGVYLNRLQRQMRLECDATILYAMGVRKVLSLDDLKYESPYNTYLHEGLPPGPICNPGLKSIKAALRPSGDFLYYVRNDVKGDGSHAFGRTFDEHEENIRKYAR